VGLYSSESLWQQKNNIMQRSTHIRALNRTRDPGYKTARTSDSAETAKKSPWFLNIRVLRRKYKFMKHRVVAVQIFVPVGVSNLKGVQCAGAETETNINYNNFIKIIMIQWKSPVIIKPGHSFTCVWVSETKLVFYTKNLPLKKEWNCSFLGRNFIEQMCLIQKVWLAFWRLNNFQQSGLTTT
jgi:hypothetical protein